MQFTNTGYLQLDKWCDKIFVPGWGGGIDQEIRSSFFNAGIKESETLLEANEVAEIDGDHAVWIWAHGNKHRDFIGGGADEMFSPRKIAKKLSGLPTAATGNVVVWSCWAGWPNGFCEQLAGIMQKGGYGALRFWGALVPTSILQRSRNGNQWADVYVQAQGKSGDTLPRAAKREDMEGFGPGLQMPYWRSHEAPAIMTKK